jgi:hypothetical protein
LRSSARQHVGTLRWTLCAGGRQMIFSAKQARRSFILNHRGIAR